MQRNGLIRVLIFFLLFAGSLRAQPGDNTFLRLTKDSLEYALIDNWHYSAGDNMHWASLAYPDSNWQIESTWQGGRHPKQILPRISWWRKRISIDSSLAGKSLALVMQQSGASELYVNGALLTKFGTIDSGGQVLEHYTSGGQPYVFVLADTGTYLLAVRHARSKADTWAQGFAMSVDHANRAIEQDRANAIGNTGISLFLFGLFLAFSILHGTMYLYYRAGRSNLWFAIFSFCLAFIFLGICANVMHSMRLVQVFGQSLFYIVLLACFALSGFINSVFFKRRIWLRVLILAAVPFTFLGEQVIGKIVVAAIISASIETVLTIGFAMYRRLPGARIIASGLLLFAALLLYLFLKIVLQGDAGLNLSGREANIAMLVFGAAILCMLLSMSAYLAWNFATMSKALKIQLTEVERLSAEARRNEAEKQQLLESRQEELEREVAMRTEELRRQKQKSDDLLLNILPAEVAEELKERGAARAKQYEDVTVLFTDFVDFTQWSESLAPEAVVDEIDSCFRAFDSIIEQYGLEKIKTVGDAYIAVSGLPVPNAHHARDVLRAALEIKSFMEERRREQPHSFGIRMGVHSGPVVAGIVGVKKFAYDIWGDTVNTAARMEQHSEPGELNISETTYAMVRDQFLVRPRGALEVKHKGCMRMYFVDREQVMLQVQ